ncbi:MAG: Z1 domain-containing protein [Lachnospiraceae bacterium]
MNDLQKKFKNMVAMFISDDSGIQEYMIDQKICELRSLPTFSELTDEQVDEVGASIKSEFSIKLDVGVLIEEKGHEKWFLSQKSKLDMKYWERYRKYLLTDKEFSTNVVNTMDDVLDTLTDLLGDPSRDISYGRRGLIIGDVQSGKTANYTGLICKAADSGYKVIVLLTGTLEKLRQQTQQRIDEGFVGAASDAMMKQQEEKMIVGVGKYDSSIRPMVLTSTTDDFKSQNANNLGFDLRSINVPVIFVVKKNVTVLKRLNKWLKTFNQNRDQKIDHSLLVIDDESDNASVNTKADPEDAPTAINRQIRELVAAFTKSSYVGFTATPFANIFIDPDNYNAMVEEDLFPKDYIYSLNAPSNYIGARNVFSENGSAKDMLIEINDDDTDPTSIASILPLKHKSTHQVKQLPEDMKTAIATFLLANTIEDLDGFKDTHRSMLINVSRLTDIQDRIADLVNAYLKDMQAAIRNYSKLPKEKALRSDYIMKLKNTYETVYSKVDYTWNDIQKSLHSSCAGIVEQTFNLRAGQNVSYDDYKDGLRVIAVGGMSLSRGLTLEGLVVSYFYRNSKMYDTLMQMGRWFGYRPGYSHICRIFMSVESIEWYRHISDATDELREEIKRYEDTSLTPMDFGLRVRSDITTLLVTARNKMRSAEGRESVISLSGECLETPEIYSDEEKNKKNIQSVQDFVDRLTEDRATRSDIDRGDSTKFGYVNVPMETVIEFLEKLDVSPKNEQFNIQAITRFIKDYRGVELKKWDIAFATGKSHEQVDFGNGIRFNYPTRSFSVINDGKILKMSGQNRRIGGASDGQFGLDAGTLYEIIRKAKEDGIAAPSQKLYFRNIKRNPLLTIYIVELKSLKDDSVTDVEIREDMKKYEGKTVIGFGIGIPSLSDQETKYARYIMNKIAIQQIFEGEIDWDSDEDGED